MTKKDHGKSCCKDEHKNLSIEKDQNVNTDNDLSIKSTQVLFVSTFLEYSTLLNPSVSIFGFIASNDPPEKSNVPLYLRNRVFRI